MMKYPETIQELEEELLRHSKDGRSDILFRFVIMHAQLGDLAAYLSHDQVLNPTARPYGTNVEEMNAVGHAVVQTLTYASLVAKDRGFDLQKAINMALDNLREKDFVSREKDEKEVCKGLLGTSLHSPVSGIAWVDPFCTTLRDMPPGSILVSRHPQADATQYLLKSRGVVTDNGGLSCHAAIICRENGIPCVVGTGNATKKFRTGEKIVIRRDGIVEKSWMGL
jgi:phosphohistidine swiveling domain-containing protein